MTLSAHKALFSLIVLAAVLGFGWILIIYVLSFHAAQWVVERIEGGYAPRRMELRPVPYRVAYRPAPRAINFRHEHRRPVMRLSRG
jgi:hypothetical protein